MDGVVIKVGSQGQVVFASPKVVFGVGACCATFPKSRQHGGYRGATSWPHPQVLCAREKTLADRTYSLNYSTL